MFKETITYEDYNGNEQTEDIYFNLTKSELTEMEMTMYGGALSKHLEKVTQSEDNTELFKLFKFFVLKAYGQKSEDGRRFIKSDELAAEFEQTAVYDALFYKYCSDADAAIRFFKNIIPADLRDEAMASAEAAIPALKAAN